jgi:hypothetical protein
MSPIAFVALFFAISVFAVIIFVAIVVGIHSEPRYQMNTTPRRPLAVMIRRLLGVYVARPADADADSDRQECLTGNSTEWWNKGGWDR